MERTVRKIAVPGKIAQWGAKSRLSLASKRSRPQVGMSGGKPRPRNDSVDSAMIAAATSMVPATITGPSAFGRICLNTRRGVVAPSARAASTNSFSRNDRNWARTSRQRDPPAIQHARQQILAEIVGAERVLPRRCDEPRGKIDFVDRHAPEQRPEPDGEGQRRQDHHARNRQAVAAKLSPRLEARRNAPQPWLERDGKLSGRRCVGQASHRGYRPRG